jgi:PqqD family protein of HPr-rel-A system
MVGSADITTHSWQLCDRSALLMRNWGEDFAVFNPLSGHTHILDYTAGILLQALVGGSLSETDLQRILAAKLGFEEDEPLAVPLGQLLTQLDDQGLIARVSPC